MSTVFPSEFAKNIAIGVDLYPPTSVMAIKDKDERNFEIAKMVMLKEFQQMSVYGSFNDALIVYDSVVLGEEQITALKTIHKSTAPWARGLVAEKMLASISSSKKDSAMNAKVLIESLDGTLTESDVELIDRIMGNGNNSNKQNKEK